MGRASVSPAQAQTTGNDLLASCISEVSFKQGYCMGFIAGIGGASPFICHPRGDAVTVGQMHDIVVQGLQREPQIRDMPADVLATKYLMLALPCKTPTGCQPGIICSGRR